MTFLVAAVALVAIEVVVLIEVARQIGVLAAIALLLATSILGPPLVRRAGFGMWRRARQRLNRGQIPGREALDGILLLAAGLLICLPGFVTDAVGLLLLLPPVRRLARSVVSWRLLRRARTVVASTADGRPDASRPGGTIDVVSREPGVRPTEARRLVPPEPPGPGAPGERS